MRARFTLPGLNALAALVAGCAAPGAPGAPPPAYPAQERYEARGQEPGWLLLIHDGRIDYNGEYGQTKISVSRPDPRPSFNGRRYVTPRLTVDVTYVRCNDGMSGRGYEHQVTVSGEGKTVKGCGGARKPEWDM
jgi:uncharacterized membrane protein